jgi:hypothetical protein
MPVFVYLVDEDFVHYLTLRNVPNCPETFQQFLKTVGTTQISIGSFHDSFVLVPEGSCIRLRTHESYANALASLLPPEKQDKSRRSSSCCVM